MTDSCCITGEIRNPRREAYVEWKLENYFSLSQKADTFITSPSFHFSNESWYLRIYPNGARCDNSVEWFSFYLGREDPINGNVSVTINLGIKYGDSRTYLECQGSCFFHSNAALCGWDKFIERSELQRNRYKIATEGALTVFCKAKLFSSVAEAASQTILFDGTHTLAQNFQTLLHSERKSDVTIKVKSRLFRVHKLILETRSSVFSAMFEHNMKENSSGIVDIADCEPDVFHDFLSFVYTGKIENLSSDNATGLHFLADKYDLPDLKAIIIDYMKDNLRLDSVCEVLAMADRHNEAELRKSAAELIRKNMGTIIPTDQWISFMAEYPVLAAELLMTVIPAKF